jgi:hypothetical protein
MKLYLIERTDNYRIYDNYFATVVAAPTEERARELALALFAEGDQSSSDEFLDVSTVAISALVPEGIILSEYNAG